MAEAPEGAMSEEVARLHIRLIQVQPSVWRRVDMPTHTSLAILHRTIQTAFGWHDSHLWMFITSDGTQYGEPHPDYASRDQPRDATRTQLRTLLNKGCRQLIYRYDFGDKWDHEITIEDIREGEPGREYPAYVGGRRRRPPEDCGSTQGYRRFLEEISNPANPAHAGTVNWYAKYNHENRYTTNDDDRQLVELFLSAIARRRRGGMGRGDKARQEHGAKERARKLCIPAMDKSRQRLADQGWIDDHDVDTVIVTMLDAIEAATARHSDRAQALGDLLACGMLVSRKHQGHVYIEHCVSDTGLGTDLMYETDGPIGLIRVQAGLDTIDPKRLRCLHRLGEVLASIAADTEWTRANPGRHGPEAFQQGAQQIADLQRAVDNQSGDAPGNTSWYDALDQLVSEIDAAEADLIADFEEDETTPTRIRISGRKGAELRHERPIVVRPYRSERFVRMSNQAQRIPLQIAYDRRRPEGQRTRFDPVGRACLALAGHFEKTPKDTVWDRAEWNRRLDVIASMRGLWQMSAADAARSFAAIRTLRS